MAAICPDFKWVGLPDFQIPLEILTICKPTYFWPFEIRTGCILFYGNIHTWNITAEFYIQHETSGRKIDLYLKRDR